MSEHMRDGLEHIIKVCRMARTQSRRTRWIESRARSAINGDDDWRYADLPKNAPDYKKQRDELLDAINKYLDNDGSRNVFSALNLHDAREELTALIKKIKGGE